MSLRDRIQAANDIRNRLISVPEWSVEIEIRTLTAIERTRLVKSCTDDEGNVDLEKMYPMLLIASCYDPETGGKVFDLNDMEMLGEKSASAIEFVARQAMDLSGMNATSVDSEGKDN